MEFDPLIRSICCWHQFIYSIDLIMGSQGINYPESESASLLRPGPALSLSAWQLLPRHSGIIPCPNMHWLELQNTYWWQLLPHSHIHFAMDQFFENIEGLRIIQVWKGNSPSVGLDWSKNGQTILWLCHQTSWKRREWKQPPDYDWNHEKIIWR